MKNAIKENLFQVIKYAYFNFIDVLQENGYEVKKEKYNTYIDENDGSYNVASQVYKNGINFQIALSVADSPYNVILSAVLIIDSDDLIRTITIPLYVVNNYDFQTMANYLMRTDWNAVITNMEKEIEENKKRIINLCILGEQEDGSYGLIDDNQFNSINKMLKYVLEKYDNIHHIEFEDDKYIVYVNRII